MRLVSLAPSNTEIVHALGLEDWLVGVDDWSDYPPEVVAPLPRVGPDLQIDVDRVAALRPDLVLASLSVPGMERVVEAVQARGLPHVVLNPLTIEEVYADLLRVGDLTGTADRARRVVADLRERARRIRAEVEAAFGPGAEPLRAYLEWWPKPLITPGRRSWVNDQLALAGGRNVFEDLDVASQPVNDEDVFARDPDVILLCWQGSLERVMDPERVRSRPGWAERLRAVSEGRIFVLPEDLFGRPGPRLIDGAAMLARIFTGQCAVDA
ncbi:MAG TPA: cobalamin-binding protein [Bacillota bacterium]